MSDATRRQFLKSAALATTALATDLASAEPPADLTIPDRVFGVTRKGFLSPGEVDRAARAGVQVVHTNLVWPYFPPRKEGRGLSADDCRKLRDLVKDCHGHGMRLCLGLPPFPPVSLVERHPDWRVHPDDTGAAIQRKPKADDLGTRLGCNLGLWGDYLIEVCGELVADYGLDGFSFNRNYHPPICYVNTAANHGLPSSEVPLREETLPVYGIRVTFRDNPPTRFRCEPGCRAVEVKKTADAVTVACPPLDIHAVLVGEY